MIGETLVNGAFFVIGYALLSCSRTRVRSQLDVVLPAYFVGVLAYVLVTLLASAIGILYPLICLSLLVVVATVLIAKNWHVNKQTAAVAIVGLLTVLGISTLSEQNLWTVASYDSFRLLLIGQPLTLEQGFTDKNIGYFASWGILIPIVQGLSPSIGTDYLNTLQPMISILGVIFIGYAFYEIARKSNNRPSSLAVSSVALVFLVSTYFFAFQMVYLHNSMASAIYLTMGTLGLLRWQNNGELATAVLCFTGFLGFSLLRVETPLFCAVFLACLYPIGPKYNTGYRYFLWLLTAVICAWYGYLALQMGSGTDILTPGRVLIIISPLVAWTCAIELTARLRYPLFEWCLNHAPHLILGLAIVALGIGFIVDHDHLVTTLNNMATNAFTHGRWGVFWHVTWLLAFVAFVASTNKETRILLITCTIFLIGVVLLSLGREPYRVGWGDSANRMTTHIAGIMWLAIVYFIAPLVSAKTLPRLGLRQLSLITGIIMLFTNPWFGLLLPLANQFEQAEVVIEPVWKRNNPLARATQLLPSRSYAAANESGKAQIKFKLNRRVTQGVIEVRDYHPDLAMTSYQWSARATDGFYSILASVDSDAGMNRNVYYLSDAHYCVYFDLPKATKYIRFDFIRGKDQNRLLLKQLALFTPNSIQKFLEKLLGPNAGGCPSTPPNKTASA